MADHYWHSTVRFKVGRVGNFSDGLISKGLSVLLLLMRRQFLRKAPGAPESGLIPEINKKYRSGRRTAAYAFGGPSGCSVCRHNAGN